MPIYCIYNVLTKYIGIEEEEVGGGTYDLVLTNTLSGLILNT